MKHTYIYTSIVAATMITVAQTSSYSDSISYNVYVLFNMLLNLLIVLIAFIAPILLFYGFAKSTIDTIRALRLKIFSAVKQLKKMLPFTIPLLVGQTAVDSIARSVDQMFAVVAALLMIVIPFTILLLFWKGFTKLIKV